MKRITGEWFCSNLGVERILSIPQIKTADVNLQKDNKYQECLIKPSMLKHEAVRGLTGSNRPFIILKLDVFDSTTKKKVDTVALVIIQRYSDKSIGQDYRIIDAVSDKKYYDYNFFGLYTLESLNLKHLNVIRDLLEGKEAQPAIHILRLASG